MNYIGFLAQAGEKPLDNYFIDNDLRELKNTMSRYFPRNWRKIDTAVIYGEDGLMESYLVDGEWVDG